ncbi:hypothetical protein B188_15960 [Candidatus Brocadiaceae bacterium B188]|nr:hypothetical protein B188_15960 [Candidatus Brocadiaceae bacterium B188]
MPITMEKEAPLNETVFKVKKEAFWPPFFVSSLLQSSLVTDDSFNNKTIITRK